MVEKICSAVMLRLGAFDLLCPVVRSGLKKPERICMRIKLFQNSFKIFFRGRDGVQVKFVYQHAQHILRKESRNTGADVDIFDPKR